MSKGKILSFGKQKWWLVVAVIQFLFSFLYTGSVFTSSALPGNTGLQVLEGGVSSTVESLLAVLFTRTIGFSLIMLLWYLVGRLFSGKFSKGLVCLFFVLFAGAAIYDIFLYPDMFAIEKDTYIIFSHAIREIPYYWHQVLTGYFLGGCMVLFPHPIIIPLLQSGAFIGVICYGIAGMNRLQKGKGYYLLLLLLLPEAMYLMIEPYRNCFYTIISMWACLSVLFGILEHKTFEAKRLALEIPFFAILAVWRTEGIFLGVVLMFLTVVYLHGFPVKKLLLTMAVFLASVWLINQVQNFGTAKYYGKDYLFVSTMNSARAIIRNGSNLNYEGAGEDIAVINEVCPDVAVEGVLGFRKANEAAGRNINQSAISEELQSKYTKAYVRLLLHNPKTFLWNQMNYALTALGTEGFFPLIYDYGQSPEHYDSWVEEYREDSSDLLHTACTKDWESNTFRKAVIDKLGYYRSILRKYIEVTRIPVALHFIVYIYLFLLLFRSLFRCLKREHWEWYKVLLIAALFAQFGVIVLTMPESRESYFYAVNMCMNVTAFILCMVDRKDIPEQTH